MRSSRFTRIGMVAVGVLLLVWVVVLFATRETTRTGPAKVDRTRCPDCGKPLPPGAQLTGECPYCLIEHGKEEMEARRRQRQMSGLMSPVIPVILIGVFCVLLAVHLTLGVRARLTPREEEGLHHYHCPRCGRKLRYRDRQIGQASLCPMCRRPLIFPRPLEQPKEPGYRTVARRLLRLLSLRSHG
jgi:hypothetical protein